MAFSTTPFEPKLVGAFFTYETTAASPFTECSRPAFLYLYSHTAFSFYVTASGLDPFAKVDASKTASIDFTWDTDSCALTRDATGNTVVGAKRNENGACVDGSGTTLQVPEDMSKVFPNGFTSLQLKQGFAADAPVTNLLTSVPNSGSFVGIQKKFTLSNLASMKSDYYTLMLAAVDANGNLVRGQSPVIAIQAQGTLPPLSKINLYSPLTGAYWLANTEYRIRFEVPPASGLTPDRFHVDLLTPSGTVIARVIEASFPLAQDDLLGTNHYLNYTIWKVPKELNNRSFKLRVTGALTQGADGFVNLSDPPVVESGIFFIGPAKPDNTTKY